MIQQNDIVKTDVVCDSINFKIVRDKLKPTVKLSYNINVKWAVYAVRQDNRGSKMMVKYIFKSEILEGVIEITVMTGFNCEVTEKELSLKENQKVFALLSVDYVIQWIGDVTSKMGISPLIIPSKLLTDLIHNA